jgi:hypothetical protein
MSAIPRDSDSRMGQPRGTPSLTRGVLKGILRRALCVVSRSFVLN